MVAAKLPIKFPENVVDKSVIIPCDEACLENEEEKRQQSVVVDTE